MAKQDKKEVSKLKIKKKIWYSLFSPKALGSREIGESYLSEAQAAVGRRVQANLRDLTGNPKDQNAYVNFRISKVNGNRLDTEAIGYELTPSFIKRAVRKNTNRMDDYFVLRTKEGKKVIVKTLMITLHKVQRSKRAALKKLLDSSLKEEASKVDFENFVINAVNYRLQSGIKKRLAKIYPLKELAIRKLILEEHAELVEPIVEIKETKEETVEAAAEEESEQ